MEFTDLKAQYRSMKGEVDAAIARVIERGQFILGPEGDALEHEIAEYCGVRFAVGLNSGTDALRLALRGLGIGDGDEVITTPFTFVATAEMVAAVGARPVFVDIDETYNINPGLVERSITQRAKAIIAVDLYGLPADYEKLESLATSHRLALVEDAAQSIGARIGDRKTGSFGTCAALSFFPAKNLGAYGDAGMVLTNDELLADRVRLFRNHGAKQKYHHELIGDSSRLDELQAAILRVKLPHLQAWNEARQRIAQRYSDALRGQSGVTAVPDVAGDRTGVFHQYTIRVERRDELVAILRSKGIPTAIHYPVPLHLQPAFQSLGYKNGDFPIAEQASREVLSLPCYPELPLEEVDRIAEAVKKYAR